jgi:hypothetical protein
MGEKRVDSRGIVWEFAGEPSRDSEYIYARKTDKGKAIRVERRNWNVLKKADNESDMSKDCRDFKIVTNDGRTFYTRMYAEVEGLVHGQSYLRHMGDQIKKGREFEGVWGGHVAERVAVTFPAGVASVQTLFSMSPLGGDD